MTLQVERRIEAQDAGSSLMEMLVVLSIIGLLFSIAVPSFHSLTKPRPETVARDVLHMAQLMRLSALKTGAAQDLVIDAKAGFIQSASGTKRIRVPPAISFSATIGVNEMTTVERGSIRFFPDGGATGGAIRFFAKDLQGATVTVNWLTGIAILSVGDENGSP